MLFMGLRRARCYSVAGDSPSWSGERGIGPLASTTCERLSFDCLVRILDLNETQAYV